MAAITWRNIESSPIDSISRAYSAAQQGINAGFGNVNNVLQDWEKMGADNWNQQKTNNTQAFMDELGKYRTPEEYQAAVQSGTLDRMRQGYQAQIDAPAARAAEEARLGILQNRLTTSNAYEDSQRQRTEAPEMDRITQLALTDPIAAQAALADAPIKFKAVMQKTIADATKQNVEAERATTKFGFDVNEEARKASDQKIQEALAPLQRDQTLAATEHSRAATTELAGTKAAETAKAETKRQREERLALRTKVAEGGVFNLGATDSKEGYKAINDHLASKLVNPDDVPLIQKELGDLNRKPILGKNGQAIPIPTKFVIDAIQSMGERGYTGRWVNQVSDQVRQRVMLNEDKILSDQADLLKLDFTDATRPVALGDVSPPATNAPVAPLQKAAEKVVNTPPAKVVDPDIAAIAEARSLQQGSFNAIQNEIRKSGGIDNATPVQIAELNRAKAAISALDSQDKVLRANVTKQLSEQRRIADQEDAVKKARGR